MRWQKTRYSIGWKGNAVNIFGFIIELYLVESVTNHCNGQLVDGQGGMDIVMDPNNSCYLSRVWEASKRYYSKTMLYGGQCRPKRKDGLSTRLLFT